MISVDRFIIQHGLIFAVIRSHFLRWTSHITDGNASGTYLQWSLPHMWLIFVCWTNLICSCCCIGFVMRLLHMCLIDLLRRLMINCTSIGSYFSTLQSWMSYIIRCTWYRLLYWIWMLSIKKWHLWLFHFLRANICMLTLRTLSVLFRRCNIILSRWHHLLIKVMLIIRSTWVDISSISVKFGHSTRIRLLI